MLINKTTKVIAFFRFIIRSFLFRKSGWNNFCFGNAHIRGHKRISIGQNNIFARYSNLIIDSYSNKQRIELGNNNFISSYAILRSHGGYIELKNDVFIGERTQIQGRGGVIIGDNTLIAANCFISSSNHNYNNPDSNEYLKKEIPQKTIIGDHVWIGANCVILAGIKISNFVIVAAGSVVTKDVEDYTMVAGNPARPLKKFDNKKKEWIRIKFSS